MEPKLKENKDLIPKKEYIKILKGLELEDIYFTNGKFSLKREELSPDSGIKVRENASFEIGSGNFVNIMHTYKLNVINKENRKRSINIECTFNLFFLSKEEFVSEFFEIFKEINLPIHTWPFFREYVFSITSRMNIPPISLPLLKRNL